MSALACVHCSSALHHVSTDKLPRLLWCSHSICTGCLEQSATTADSFECPIDHQCTSLGSDEGKSERLPVNVALTGLLSKWTNDSKKAAPLGLSSSHQHQNTFICEACPSTKQSEAVKHCVKCETDLCAACDTMIHVGKMDTTHERVAVQHKLILQRNSKLCTIHGEKLHYFCTTDQKAICTVCKDTSHSKHRVKPVEELMSDIQQSFTTAMNQLTQHMASLQQLNAADAEAVGQTEAGVRQHQTALSAHFDLLRKALNDRQQQLANELTQRGATIVQTLHHRRKVTAVVLSQLTASLEEAKALLKTDRWSVLAGQKELLASLANVQSVSTKCMAERPVIDTKSDLHFNGSVAEILPTYGSVGPVLPKPPSSKPSLSISATASSARDQSSPTSPGAVYTRTNQLDTKTEVHSNTATDVKSGHNSPVAGSMPLVRLPPSGSGGTVENSGAVASMGARNSHTTQPTVHLHPTNGSPRQPKVKLPGHIRQFGTKGKHAPRMNTPQGVAVSQGMIYVVDEKNRRVLVFKPDGTLVRKFGAEGKGMLVVPYGIAVGEGQVFVTDSSNESVQVYREADGSYVRTLGSKGDDDRKGQLSCPSGIVVHQGEVYVADSGHSTMHVFRCSDGAYVRSLGSFGAAKPSGGSHRGANVTMGAGTANAGIGTLDHPAGLAIHADTQELYVADVEHGTIQVFDLSTGAFRRVFNTSNSPMKHPPRWVWIHSAQQQLCVSDVTGEAHLFQLSDGGYVGALGSTTNVGALSGAASLDHQWVLSDRDRHCVHLFG